MNDFLQHFKAEEVKQFALKDQVQLPAMIDILSRRERHHLFLVGANSNKIFTALLEALVLQLTNATTPKNIRDAEIIFLDINQLKVSDESILERLEHLLNAVEKPTILAINQITPLLSENSNSPLNKIIKKLLLDTNWRIIVFSPVMSKHSYTSFFSTLQLNELTKAETIAVLKFFRDELENYHQVTISDDTVSSAFSMASHFLHEQSPLDETVELLDSSAARAGAIERTDTTNQIIKPVVTTSLLTTILSCRTQIPITHLHNNKFQASQFNAAISRRVHGQDPAIGLIASTLQHSCIKLRKKSGPLCSFLFAGSVDVGKTETAHAMAEHLFGHANALLQVNLSKTHYASFSDIKIISDLHENRCISLLQAIRQTPYAVVLIENINQAPADTLDLFKDIFIQGYTMDAEGNQCDFRNAIIVMTTTLGAEKINQLTQAPHTHEPAKSVDLMQLVLNENLHDSSGHTSHPLSLEEIRQEISPILEEYFSHTLLQCVDIVPFMPLDYAALEKIMKLKIKALAKQLDANFEIELNYAPEVIKFIAHEALWRKPNTISLDKLLEQHLYSCISHEILAHSEDKNRAKRLLLQLNENGQLLRCEFVSANESMSYAL